MKIQNLIKENLALRFPVFDAALDNFIRIAEDLVLDDIDPRATDSLERVPEHFLEGVVKLNVALVKISTDWMLPLRFFV